MPPPRRRPATPPTRRPKVAGLHRRADHADDTTHTSDVDVDKPESGSDLPAFDVPVIGEHPTNGHHTEKTAEKTPAKDVAERTVEETSENEVKETAEEKVRPTPRRRVPMPRKRDPKPEATAADTTADTANATATATATATEADTAKAGSAEPEAAGTDEIELPDATAEVTTDGDAAEADAEAATESAEQAQDRDDQPGQLKLLVPAILVVVALLLGGLGYWFAQNLSDARTGLGNDALADVNTTKDIVGAANTAVTSVLSYKFDDMPGAAKRAKEYLAGEAVEQYDKSMKALEADIQNQKLQVVVTPVSVGVVRFQADDARVLVYADQVGTRADKQPSGGPTQFAMDMRFTDGKWKIVKLDFFELPK